MQRGVFGLKGNVLSKWVHKMDPNYINENCLMCA